MSTTRTAKTHWEGTLFEGAGQVTLESSGLGTYDVTWAARAEAPDGKTSPEELIAAAWASCFAMALSHGLAQGGNAPEKLETSATVTFQPGEGIIKGALTVVGTVAGVDEDAFKAAADDAKANCPVSKALAGIPDVSLEASLA